MGSQIEKNFWTRLVWAAPGGRETLLNKGGRFRRPACVRGFRPPAAAQTKQIQYFCLIRAPHVSAATPVCREIRHWHPKFRRLGRHLGVDEYPRGYWFLCNKVGGLAANIGCRASFKGNGIKIHARPMHAATLPIVEGGPMDTSESHAVILPIVDDSMDDEVSDVE